MKKPNLQEVGVIGSRIKYKWAENPDELIAKKGIKYLGEIARDTHISSCLRTRRQKLLKTPWQIRPADNSEEAIFWAEFVQWNLENMEGEFLQDLEGLHRAVGYGFSVSEINWRIIEEAKYAGMIGIRSICFKPEELVRFQTNEFGHVEKIILTSNYGLDGVELPLEKSIHVVYGDNDENPYGDPTLSRVAFWAWLKKNEAQFWAIFSEKFGMPTAKAKIPNNATAKEREAIQSLLQTLQSESGVMLPEGFDLSFLEATRSGDVGYDNFIERCNKEISKEILGQTLTSEEGKRGQGSYALGTIHAATLDDYVAFDAAMIQSAINKQLIRRLIRFHSNTDLIPQFEFVSEIDPLILAQNFPAIAEAIPIPQAWLYKKFAIPFPKQGEPVAEVKSKTANPAKGIDNNALSVFAESVENLLEKRESELQKLDTMALNVIAEQMDAIFESVTNQFKKKITEGEAIEVPPKYSVNVGEVKQSLINAATMYYLVGKYYARQKLMGKIDLPEPKPIKKFAELDDLQFQSPEEAIKYFSGLVNITKAEMKALLELYEERYFTVAGLIKGDIEKIYNNIVVGLEKGWNWKSFESAVNAQKIKYTGTVFGQDMTDQPLGANHLKTIFQNNMMRAYQEGAQALYDDPEVADAIWGYEYRAVGDDRTRPSHAALNGVVREKSDPFWLKYTPPWDHNCRCDRIPILRSQIIGGEYERTAQLPKINPEEGFETRRIF
jgi:SPP1 gp7 family putative phage head morphogenesis protein